MSVRASSLDQHGLQRDEKHIIATRLHNVGSPGCPLAVALLNFCLYNCVCVVISKNCSSILVFSSNMKTT